MGRSFVMILFSIYSIPHFDLKINNVICIPKYMVVWMYNSACQFVVKRRRFDRFTNSQYVVKILRISFTDFFVANDKLSRILAFCGVRLSPLLDSKSLYCSISITRPLPTLLLLTIINYI